MNSRVIKKMDEIGTVIGGATPSTKIPAYWDGDIPWLTPKDLAGFKERYIKKGPRNITPEGLNSCSTQVLPKGSVLFTSRAPIGYIAIAENEICTNQGFKSIIPNSDTDPLFLFYLLKHNKNCIENMGSGTTFKEVSASTMRSIEVEVPESIEEQQKIAEVLDCLDSKIELNNRINDYLVKLRNVLVKEKISAALDQSVGSWQVVPLKKVAHIQSGYSYKSAEFVDSSDIGMIGIKNFNRNGSFRSDGFKPLKPERAKPTQYVALGEIVVSHTDLTQNADIIGRAVQVIDAGGFNQMIASLDLVKVTSIDNSISNEFLAALLGTEDFHNHCLGYVNGTTVLHLGKKALPDYLLKIPEDSMFTKKLDSVFKSIAKQQARLIRENRGLDHLRELLLPKLMSGEIDVSRIDLTQLNNHLCDC